MKPISEVLKAARMPARQIAFVAPSGWVADPATLDRAAQYFAGKGWTVQADDMVFERHERFAGTDAQRSAALMQAATTSGADLVMAVRGGYGLSRLLDQLDWKALGKSKSLFIGHSDFTAFHLALLAKTGRVSFAGPMASFDFGAVKPSAFMERNFWRVLEHDEVIIDIKAARQPKVDLEGTLWGGNLALVAALVGTPYLPRIEGGILFLEDVAEHPYAIERMLYQLWHAGVLGRQQALILGGFTEYKLGASDNGYDFDRMLAQARRAFGLPILTGLPFGHVHDKLTLPVGAHCHVQSQRGGYRLYLGGYPTLA